MKSLVSLAIIRSGIFLGAESGRIIPCFRKLIGLASGLAILVLGWLTTLNAVAASFSPATPLNTARGGQTATLLSNGKLLVAGGQTNGGFTSPTAELYDPAAGTWTAVAPMNADRAHHTATMLPNGKVLVAGGFSTVNGALPSAELYDSVQFLFNALDRAQKFLMRFPAPRKAILTGTVTMAHKTRGSNSAPIISRYGTPG